MILDGAALWGGSILFGAVAAFVWKFSVPLTFVFLASDEILKLPFSFWRYKSLKWLKNITREQQNRRFGENSENEIEAFFFREGCAILTGTYKIWKRNKRENKILCYGRRGML